MSQVAIEGSAPAPMFSRRVVNQGLAGGMGARALEFLGVGVVFNTIDQHFVDHRSSEEKSFPKDFFTRDVKEWSPEAVKAITDEEDFFRSTAPLVLDTSSRTGFLEGGGFVAGGNMAEITIAPVYNETPTYDALEIIANGQRRLAVVAATPDPKPTTVQFDKFETDAVEVEIIQRSLGQLPLSPDQIRADISYFRERCSAEVIKETVNGLLPWKEYIDDPGRAAPFQGFSVLYIIDGMPAVLHVVQMLWEEKGTGAHDLYFDTKELNGNAEAGRTIDSEWMTLIIFHPDGSREIKIQELHHTTAVYDGELENGVRPVIRTAHENYNFKKASREEVEAAQFAYGSKIISPQEYRHLINRPDPYIQWLSITGLYLKRKIGGMNDPIVKDFFTVHPEMKGRYAFPPRN